MTPFPPAASGIRLIGLDLDDTTFNTKKEITPRVQNAIRRACESGIAVLPATGRQLHSIPREFLDIPGVRYALTANGAKVYSLADESIIHRDCMPLDSAFSLLETIRRFSCLTSVFVEGENYTDIPPGTRLEDYLIPEMIPYFKNSRYVVPDLAAVMRRLNQPIEKFSLIYGDATIRTAARAAFLARGDCTVTSSMPGNLELNSPTANKGAGLVALGKALGIPREGIMAVGDSSNDLDMIETVGLGVAMGNARQSVKDVADWITATCDEDGVAVAIEKVLEAKSL